MTSAERLSGTILESLPTDEGELLDGAHPLGGHSGPDESGSARRSHLYRREDGSFVLMELYNQGHKYLKAFIVFDGTTFTPLGRLERPLLTEGNKQSKDDDGFNMWLQPDETCAFATRRALGMLNDYAHRTGFEVTQAVDEALNQASYREGFRSVEELSVQRPTDGARAILLALGRFGAQSLSSEGQESEAV